MITQCLTNHNTCMQYEFKQPLFDRLILHTKINFPSDWHANVVS